MRTEPCRVAESMMAPICQTERVIDAPEPDVRQLRSGTDVMLFNGLLTWLAQHDQINHEFVTGHTSGAGAALLAAENTAGDIQSVSRLCGLDTASVRRFYEWFACTDRVVTAFSQGVTSPAVAPTRPTASSTCTC
jgi:assimilatory nitrate reductase catalytic subunit